MRVALVLRRALGVHDGDLVLGEAQLGDLGGDVLSPGQQDRMRNPLVDEDLRRTQDLVLLALRKDDALRILLGAIDHHPHELEAPRDQMFEAMPILLDGSHRNAGDAALLGRLGHRRSDVEQDAVVERLGNEVVAAELERLDPVGLEHRVGHVLAGEPREGARRCELHRAVDVGGSGIERAAEEEGEAEDVVHLIGIVTSAGSDDGVGTGRQGFVVADLRGRVGHGEDDRIRRHLEQHLGRDGAGDREADEHVRSYQRVLEGARRCLGGELHLLGVGVVRAAAVDDSLAVAEDDVLLADSELEVEAKAAEGGGTGAGEHELHILDALAGNLERIDECRAGDDRRAVLIVVEDRDVHLGLEPALDLETLGRLDVLEIDAAEGRLQRA